MTIEEVKEIHERLAPDYFFSPDAMRFNRQTLRSFSVRPSKLHAGMYIIAANAKNWEGKLIGVTRRLFDPTTGKLHLMGDDE